ncbi:MAG: hypothetical protein JWM89_2276 [Acidimicrobiales bacterium]|nr:hypothetical protein [Acidimicrobiales bacterium]
MAKGSNRAKRRRPAPSDAPPGAPTAPRPSKAVRAADEARAATKQRIRIAAGVGMVLAVAIGVAFSGPGGNSPDSSTATSGSTPGPSGKDGGPSPIPTVPPGIGPAIVDKPVAAAELGGLSFTDVTKQAGLGQPQANRALSKDGEFAGGASVVDYDQDGNPDIFLPRVGLPDLLYRNDGTGHFTDVTEKAGIGGPDPAKGSSVGAWSDVDGDGDPDLYLISAEGAPNRLYVNQGDGTFKDGTAAAGLAVNPPKDRIDAMYGATFGDFDRDGDLDLLSLHYNVAALSNSPEVEPSTVPPCTSAPDRRFGKGTARDQSQSRLYVNDGKGHFTDATTKLGLKLYQVVGFTPTFADIDDDGWPDLLITGDFCTSRVFHNDRGKGFTEITGEIGVGTDENGMGSAIEDVNGDGRLDWFVTAISYPPGTGAKGCEINNSGCSGNRLWLNEPSGKWKDVTDEYGVREGKWGWGAAAQDFDNDGDRDLLMVNGYRLGTRGPVGDSLRPYFDHFIENQTRLWLNPGKPPFVQAATAAGLDGGGLAKSAIPVDVDGDGDLDLLVSRSEGPVTLYRNDLAGDNAWLGVRLADPGSENRDGIGARVTVQATAGGPVQVTEIRSAGTYGGTTVPLAHFGFGAGVKTLARVEVRWPDGGRPTVLTDVEVDQMLRVRRP